MAGALFVPNMQIIASAMGFLATLHFLDNQRSVKSLTHLSRFAPLKSGMATSIWRQEGTHGTKTRTSKARICLRDGSCGSGDHPSDHDAQFGCAELVTDLPSSTFAFVLRRHPNQTRGNSNVSHTYDRRSVGSHALSRRVCAARGYARGGA